MVVVLPEPFGPSSPKDVPTRHLHRETVYGDDLAVPLRERRGFYDQVIGHRVSLYRRERGRGMCETLGVRLCWAAFAALTLL